MNKNWIASAIIAALIKTLIFLPIIPEIINEFSFSEWKDVILLGLVSWILLTLITKIVLFDNMWLPPSNNCRKDETRETE